MAAASSSAATATPYRIGMFGAGTVGGGVYTLLQRLQEANGSAERRPVVVSKICVRDLSKPRSFDMNEQQTEVTDDPSSILTDDSIDCVVEVMGGTGLARQVVIQALASGKDVVTANKALLAECLNEVTTTLKESQAKHSQPERNIIKPVLAYEAAVCGGIPIIQTLQTCYTGDVIQSVAGICNGTTNYMLTAMEEQGADYSAVLKEAQDLGYAEADPTADVEGLDVRAKIALLAKLAFGKTVPVENISCTGISKITSVDFEYASLLKSTVKLVGTARRLPAEATGGTARLAVYVSPVMVSKHHLLAGIRGAGNAVAVQSDNMALTTYTGPGAGRFPTANSVVSDILRAAARTVPINPFPSSLDDDEAGLVLDSDYSASFYIRIPFSDGLGIIRKTGELAEKHGISVHSILQNPMTDPTKADFCLTTDVCHGSQVRALCDELAQQDFVRDLPLFMPLLASS